MKTRFLPALAAVVELSCPAFADESKKAPDASKAVDWVVRQQSKNGSWEAPNGNFTTTYKQAHGSVAPPGSGWIWSTRSLVGQAVLFHYGGTSA